MRRRDAATDTHAHKCTQTYITYIVIWLSKEIDGVRNAVVANVAASLVHYVGDFMENDGEDNQWEKITVDVNEYCQMGDPSFRWHFRLPKPVFEVLLQRVGNHLVERNRLIRERRPLAHILLMVLWLIATPDSFRSVALRFGVYKSELHNHYAYIIEAWREMLDGVVTWPNEEERNAIKGSCERISDFPGIIGIMDGSHISIIAPHEQKAAYRNYHHGYSIKVQAVVDHNLLVRDVYIGEAGSLHDARVFRRSPLCRDLLTRANMLSEGEHIIADSAYMLTDKVLIPFLNNGHLTPQQRNYNRRLSKVRAKVEHSFARLESLWRRLFYLPSTEMDYAVDHVAASIFLHNFKIIEGERIDIGNGRNDDNQCDEDEDNVDDPMNQQGLHDVIPDPFVPQGNLANELELAHLRGEQKRWDICNRLPLQNQ